MRLTPTGKPGQYACGRCGRPQLKGVYTGPSDYHHLCSPCREQLRPRAETVSKPSEPRVLGVAGEAMTRDGSKPNY